MKPFTSSGGQSNVLMAAGESDADCSMVKEYKQPWDRVRQLQDLVEFGEGNGREARPWVAFPTRVVVDPDSGLALAIMVPAAGERFWQVDGPDSRPRHLTAALTWDEPENCAVLGDVLYKILALYRMGVDCLGDGATPRNILIAPPSPDQSPGSPRPGDLLWTFFIDVDSWILPGHVDPGFGQDIFDPPGGLAPGRSGDLQRWAMTLERHLSGQPLAPNNEPLLPTVRGRFDPGQLAVLDRWKRGDVIEGDLQAGEWLAHALRSCVATSGRWVLRGGVLCPPPDQTEPGDRNNSPRLVQLVDPQEVRTARVASRKVRTGWWLALIAILILACAIAITVVSGKANATRGGQTPHPWSAYVSPETSPESMRHAQLRFGVSPDDPSTARPARRSHPSHLA